MKKKIFAFLSNPLVSAMVLISLVGGVAHAAVDAAPTLVTDVTGLDADLFCPVVDVMFWVLISISIIIALWAAYLYVTSEGEAEKPSQARKMLLYAAIGIVIALVAKGFPEIVGSLFNTAGNTSFQLNCG